MRALVCHGPKDVRYETVADPEIRRPRDAIVRVTLSTIGGFDLHVYNGVLPRGSPTILGHEFVGVVEEVGASIDTLHRGDRVLVPSPVACGRCWFCEHRLQAHCETSNPEHYGPEGGDLTQKGGGVFGHTELYGDHPGGQAEYVRVPFADVGPRRLTAGPADEDLLLLADTLPRGWWAIDSVGLRPGETVAVFGCGPVGLMAMKSAWLKGAGRVLGIDILSHRLEAARRVAGAEIINADEQDAVQAVREMTLGRGADVCVDAAGMEAHRSVLEKVSNAVRLQAGTLSALRAAVSAVRRGGRVSLASFYFSTYDAFPLGQVVEKGITLRAGAPPVHEVVDELMALVQAGRICAADIVSHRFPLAAGARAYHVYNEKLEDCVKVVLRP